MMYLRVESHGRGPLHGRSGSDSHARSTWSVDADIDVHTSQICMCPYVYLVGKTS